MEDKSKKFRESMNIRYYGDYPFDAEELLLKNEEKDIANKKSKKEQNERKEKKGEAPYFQTIREAVEEALGR